MEAKLSLGHQMLPVQVVSVRSWTVDSLITLSEDDAVAHSICIARRTVTDKCETAAFSMVCTRISVGSVGQNVRE